jgi:hypothetical protein
MLFCVRNSVNGISVINSLQETLDLFVLKTEVEFNKHLFRIFFFT